MDSSIRRESLPNSQLQFQQILECPICKGVPYPPIYQCQLGHNICKKCKQKFKECEICKGKILDTRNYVVEDMVLSAHHTCAFKEFGCTIVEKGDTIEGHMEICKYRPGKCPLFKYDGCTQNYLKWSKIKSHLLKFHPGQLSRQNTATVIYEIPEKIKNGKKIYEPQVLELDDYTFIAGQVQNRAMFYWVILLIGAEEIAKNYEAEIQLKSDEGIEVCWKFPVYSITGRTIESVVLEEVTVFKPSFPWEDIRLMRVDDPLRCLKEIKFCVTYSVFKKHLIVN